MSFYSGQTPVAVKFILGAGGMDPAERARLLKEARAAARVAHPHIVVVHLWTSTVIPRC